MATLTGQRVNSTYKDLLQVPNSNTGLDGTLRAVESGAGTSSALLISTAGIRSSGTLAVTGASTLSSTLAVTGATTLSSTLSVTGNATFSGNVSVVGSLTLSTPVGLSSGGTNASLTADNGAIPYSTGAALALLSSTATAGRVLLSGSSAAPTWSTPTYPSASGTSGKILRSDGTNNVYSTSTFADTYSVSTILYASSANTISGLATANSGILITSGAGVPSISSTLPTAVQDNITRVGTVTAGIWTGTTIAVANGGTGVTSSNPLIQRVNSSTGAVATGASAIPFDDTIPQNTEGTEFLSLAITPKNSANILEIEILGYFSPNAVREVIGALFQDTTASALAATSCTVLTASAICVLKLKHTMVAGTTSATTFKFRAGMSSVAGATLTFNGVATVRMFGGVNNSYITIKEYQS
ncbi:MAG TPA: hypothetical protein VGK47_11880 [Nitrososphaeraceae archaeon]